MQKTGKFQFTQISTILLFSLFFIFLVRIHVTSMEEYSLKALLLIIELLNMNENNTFSDTVINVKARKFAQKLNTQNKNCKKLSKLTLSFSLIIFLQLPLQLLSYLKYYFHYKTPPTLIFKLSSEF